jgi:predicted N-acetyltransferase YhbS
VAVEPVLHGAGVGTVLVDAAVEHLARVGSGTVLLECLSQREGFYLARGFRREAEVPDPNAEMSYLMRLDLP